MRHKTCHYAAAFTFTTYLTCLEIFRWHSSFNISFFPLVGLLSTKNKREKTDKQSSSLIKRILNDELTNLCSISTRSVNRDERCFSHLKF